MNRDVIPAQATVTELLRKAEECEKQAAKQPEPQATELREQAKLYRAWAKRLRWGRWMA